MSQITQQPLKLPAQSEAAAKLIYEAKAATTATLLANDRKRAETLLLQMRYNFSLTTSSITIK